MPTGGATTREGRVCSPPLAHQPSGATVGGRIANAEPPPPTGTTQASVPAPLAGVRLARPVMCSGEGALFERAAVATRPGPSPTLTNEPLIDRSRQTVPRARRQSSLHLDTGAGFARSRVRNQSRCCVRSVTVGVASCL